MKAYIITGLGVLSLLTAGDVRASDDTQDSPRARAQQAIQSTLDVLKTKVEQVEGFADKADMIVACKKELQKLGVITSEMSEHALALYKKQEVIASHGLDPLTTPLFLFQNMTDEQFKEYYMATLDSTISDEQRFAKLYEVASIYSRMGDVYKMDDQVARADEHYLRAAHLLIEGVVHGCSPSQSRLVVDCVGFILRKTVSYAGSKQPMMSWGLDMFKSHRLSVAQKIVDLVAASDIEDTTSHQMLKVSYNNILQGDRITAYLYKVLALTRTNHNDPLHDLRLSSYNERLACRLTSDLLSVLLDEGELKPMHQGLITKWEKLLEDDSIAVLGKRCRIKAVFGILNSEDLNNAEVLYKRVYKLHMLNMKKAQ